MTFDSRLLNGISVMSAIVEAGNFARAADALGLTPSAVSRAVARLEERIGIRLFDRTPRAVTLTDEGRRFHTQVLPLLAGIADAATEVAGAADTVRGRLKVNVDPWFMRLGLAARLPQFLDAHPDVTIELLVRDSLGDMVGEGFDIAIRFGEPVTSTLIARKLYDARIITCASPAYLTKHGRPRKPSDLERHECLLFRDAATGRPFPWEFHRNGMITDVKVDGRLVLNDLATVLAICAAGYGVAQTFALGIEPFIARGALVQILAEWAEELFPLYAYYPSRHLPPAKVRAFLDFVVAGLTPPTRKKR
ncbi:MAG TPA: LysR family transcriptional regulator [Magnetospirillaceae bacterium]|jgi:DNA-binding transcriptional LysR family regulator